MNTNKSVYDLALHEQTVAHDGSLFTQALRVPGGWIYTSFDKSTHIMGSVFVPWNNEYQPPQEPKSERED